MLIKSELVSVKFRHKNIKFVIDWCYKEWYNENMYRNILKNLVFTSYCSAYLLDKSQRRLKCGQSVHWKMFSVCLVSMKTNLRILMCSHKNVEVGYKHIFNSYEVLNATTKQFVNFLVPTQEQDLKCRIFNEKICR